MWWKFQGHFSGFSGVRGQDRGEEIGEGVPESHGELGAVDKA